MTVSLAAILLVSEHERVLLIKVQSLKKSYVHFIKFHGYTSKNMVDFVPLFIVYVGLILHIELQNKV